MKQENTRKKLPFIIVTISIILIFAVIFGMYFFRPENNKTETDLLKNKEDVLLKVGEYEYTLSDIMYYIYAEEELGYIYDSLYQSLYGASYWEMADEEQDNKTGQEISKENVINAVKKDAVLYQEALSLGYSLSEEDKTEAQHAFDEFMSYLTTEQKEKNDMQEEILTYFEQQQVLNHYKDDLLVEAGFDYDTIVAGISKEEYKEYQYEYFCVYKEDDEGNLYSQQEMDQSIQMLTELKDQITPDNDMGSLVSDEKYLLVDYSDDYICEADGEAYGSFNGVDADAVIKSMKNGQVSDIIETEFGYYVFRMNDNNSSDYYDEAVNEAVTNAQEEIYVSTYHVLENKYEIILEEGNWSKIILGSIIYDPAMNDEMEE